MKSYYKIVLVVLAAALLLSGCAFSRNALIGSWKETNSGLTMVFTSEGVLELLPPPPAANAAAQGPASISYRFIDDTNISITPATVIGLTENQPIPYAVDGNTLTLDLGTQKLTLTRVP
jgi:hypothetical protein